MSRFALSSLFLSLSLRISSWSQPPKLINLIRFLLPCLWNVSTLSFLLSLLSLILPYPLASFLKFSKLLLLHLSSSKNLLTRMNWRTVVLSPIFPLSPRLLKKWFSQLSANNLYNHFQSAYRPRHSTETALLKIVNDLLLALDDGNVFLLALLDLSAAFDMIDHSILLHLLHHDFGIEDTALDWFSPYLTNCTQSVSTPCYTSKPAPISFSVPQESVLGPVLFILYTAPLSTVIEKHSVLHHSYADNSQLQKYAPPLKSLISSSLCRNVLMTLNPGWHETNLN